MGVTMRSLDSAQHQGKPSHAMALRRGVPLPVDLVCPRCGWSDVRPSRRIGLLDNLLKFLYFSPFRCRKCRNRFFRTSRHLHGTM